MMRTLVRTVGRAMTREAVDRWRGGVGCRRVELMVRVMKRRERAIEGQGFR